jgi:uncharacterized protein YcnI
MNPSNVPTAKLRIEILKYVIQEDYYPNDWWYLNDMEKDHDEGKITYEEYDEYVQGKLEDWKDGQKRNLFV